LNKPLHALRAIKRRCKAAGLPSSVSNHSFRATGITVQALNWIFDKANG
jgi:integrase